MKDKVFVSILVTCLLLCCFETQVNGQKGPNGYEAGGVGRLRNELLDTLSRSKRDARIIKESGGIGGRLNSKLLDALSRSKRDAGIVQESGGRTGRLNNEH